MEELQGLSKEVNDEIVALGFQPIHKAVDISGHGLLLLRWYRRRQGNRPLENDPAVSRVRSRLLAECADAPCRRAPDGGRYSGNRDHPRVDGERRRQQVP